MKNFKNFLLILLLGFMAVTLQAVAAEKVTLFKNSTTEANWPRFESELIKTGKLSNGIIDTKILAMIAHSHLPIGTMTLDKFTPLWLLQNNLGEEISVTEFRKKAQANEFQMIDLAFETKAPVAVKAQPVAEVAPGLQKSEPPVLTLEEKSVLQKTAADSVAGLKTLQTEIAKLSNQVKASAADKQKLIKLQADFKNLLEREKHYVTQDNVAMMLSGTVEKVSTLETKTSAIENKAAEALLFAKEAKTEVATLKQYSVVGWIASGILLLLAALTGLLAYKANKNSVAVRNSVAVVKDNLGKIETAQKSVNQIIFKYSFNEEMVSARTLSLMKVGDSFKLPLVDNSTGKISDIKLEIKITGDNQVTINGVNRQPNVPSSKVVDSFATVARAIKRADRENLITGIVEIPVAAAA